MIFLTNSRILKSQLLNNIFDYQVSRSEFASYCEESSHFFVNEQVLVSTSLLPKPTCIWHLDTSQSGNPTSVHSPLTRWQLRSWSYRVVVMSGRTWTRWASGEGEGATSWMWEREAIPLGGEEEDCKDCDRFEEIRDDDIDIRAQWDLSRKVNLKLEELAHMFFYVKLNFKLGLFSSTFWFEHSLRSENAYL